MHNSNRHILVVEDDQDINEVVAKRLRDEGYPVTQAFSGSEALYAMKESAFDLIVCDLMLPGFSGENLVETIRATNDVPIIIISARNDSSDIVSLLKSGADDYLTKPFNLDELIARVETQFRRSSANTSEKGRLYRYGKWALNDKERVLKIEGSEIELTRIEYDIVSLFIKNPKRVFTRPELYERVWGEAYGEDANTVNTHISYLRSKLKPSKTDSYIKTVWGVGFKLSKDGGNS